MNDLTKLNNVITAIRESLVADGLVLDALPKNFLHYINLTKLHGLFCDEMGLADYSFIRAVSFETLTQLTDYWCLYLTLTTKVQQVTFITGLHSPDSAYFDDSLLVFNKEYKPRVRMENAHAF